MSRHDDPTCEHGTYVGGCGIDWMCGWCESGVPWDEYQTYLNQQVRKRTHENMVATFFSAMPNTYPPVAFNIALGILKAPQAVGR
jgi:heterodisulfide reductase subunit C